MVKAEELNPRPSYIMFNGKVYEFEAFSLRARVWSYYEFQEDGKPDGLKNLSERFAKMDILACGKVLYYLLKDKTDFPKEQDFVTAFSNSNNAHERLYKCLIEIFGISEVQLSEMEKEQAEKKEKAAKA